uniref:Large ribosomal subunit protein bL21m n=1 Tax=Corethrella appendiculata TaxID=1370023 RepID=U5EPG7_9DIPT
MLLNRLLANVRSTSLSNIVKCAPVFFNWPMIWVPHLRAFTGKTELNQQRFTSTLTPPDTKLIDKINQQIANGEEGRLFAVVQLCGKQFKITAGDLILVEGYWPPQNNDRIRLDKVLLAGGKDFTLIGTPIIPDNLVDVQATIIEKSLTHTKTHFKKKRRKQYMRINFYRHQTTMIRINSIDVKDKIRAEYENDEMERIF